MTTAAIKANFSGRVYGYYGGDLFNRHEDPNASAIHTFTVPTKTTASMLGAYRSSGGVLYFHAPSNLKLHIVVGPPHVRSVTVTLQHLSGGKWVSNSPASFSTSQWGITDLYLSKGIPGLLYRTVVSTPTTVFNTGSSTVAATFTFG
ncbi:MAG TPA: hypothetical protein VFD94_09910 [Jatrophihabitans sp.]|nr:hypothetical protein [Jatrophihabitans sp.]